VGSEVGAKIKGKRREVMSGSGGREVGRGRGG